MALPGHVALGAVSGASAAVVLFTLPILIKSLVRSRQPNKALELLYQDEDGTATTESMSRYSAQVQKIVAVIFSLVGFAASISGAVLMLDLVEAWLITLAWAFILIRAVLMGLEKRSVEVFKQGVHLFLLSVLLLIGQMVILAAYTQRVTSRPWWIPVQSVATLIVLLSAVSIPRRPDVYFNGKMVDGFRSGSVLSRYTFHWVDKMLAEVNRKGFFEEKDIPVLNHGRRADSLHDKFYQQKQSSNLLWQIIRSHKYAFVQNWGLAAVTSFLVYAPPLFMNRALRYLERRDAGENVPEYEGWLWVLGLGGIKILEASITAYCYWLCSGSILIPVKNQLSAVIFAKTMRKKDVKGMQNADADEDEKDKKDKSDDNELKNTKQGTINLISVDAERIAMFLSMSFNFLCGILEAFIGIGTVVWVLGWEAPLAGLSIMVITTPMNWYFSRVYSAAQDDLMKARDRKIGVISEALQGVRQIKFSAEEARWEERIRKVRTEELHVLWRSFIADVVVTSAWIMSPIFLSVISLSVYAILKGTLTPSVAFPALACFSELEFTLSIIPETITQMLDSLVSVRRIEEYLDSPEKKSVITDSSRIAIKEAAISWAADTEEQDKEAFCLRNISLEFPQGELSVISGRTGSGKSLLLSALLGEADLVSGTIEMPRAPTAEQRHDAKATAGNWILPSAVAYVAQIPWIEDGSIKENVVFGLPLDEKRYKTTLEVCALVKDLEILPDGDLTQIGANGVNLSGGQRARCSLARAVYSRAGILIMDDIFSAVDAHVGKHIFEKCLMGELMKGRTRILVTHHLKLCLPKAKYAVSLNSGTIEHAGSVEELRERGILEQLIKAEDVDEAANDEAIIDEEEETHDLVKVPTRDSHLSRTQSHVSHKDEPKPHKPRKFVEEEGRARGAIKMAIYLEYLRSSGGYIVWALLIGLFGIDELMVLARTFWVKVWSSSYVTEAVPLHNVYHYALQRITTVAQEHHDLAYYIGVYIVLSLLEVIISIGRVVFIFLASLKASKVLFEKMTFVVLRAPLRWLDTVPTGRILNRFSKDFETIDSRLSDNFAYFLNNFLELVGVNIAAIYVSPWIVLVALVLLGVDVGYAMYYLTGGREIRRLEQTSMSPIFEQFSSALAGVGTIRAFGKSAEYVEKMFARIDTNGQRKYYVWVMQRWVTLRFGFVGAAFTILIGGFIIGLRGADASLAGFVLTFALSYNQSVNWTLRRYTSLELDMNCTERVIEYTTVPTEDQGGRVPPAGWPYQGQVAVDGLEVRYAPDLPPVLKGVSFEVKPRERVGIVGRTGAGKSSLTLALFQFIRASKGTILIDGLDIAQLNLHELRSRIAIIPQDPVLFSGTLRSNLDAFDEYSDQELRDALKRVHLIDAGDSGPGSSASSATDTNANVFRSLDSKVSEGGLNLSQGQRQLVCLARAIVSRPKILVLDEATSAVDMETDALIQKSIRDEFTDCTTLVIAHRLATVADYDRILVLGEGKVVEYDAPWELIRAKGAFWEMVSQSGETEHLVEIAEKAEARARELR